jgi:hypothetical protein
MDPDLCLRHILSMVSRVAARDSSRTAATAQDLFVALCEDHAIFELFKTMKGAYHGVLIHKRRL